MLKIITVLVLLFSPIYMKNERHGHHGHGRQFDDQQNSCNPRNRREGGLEERFHVELRSSHRSTPNLFCDNDDYEWAKNETIELICRGIYSKTLQWEDTYNFATERVYHHALRLRVKPDLDDYGLELTCRTDKENERITISFVKLPSATKDANREIIYVNKGDPYSNNATCNGVAFYPKGGSTYRLPNQTLIKTFGDSKNGTLVYCIIYANYGMMDVNGECIHTYERSKSIMTLYVNPEIYIQMSSSDKSTGSTADSVIAEKLNLAALVGGLLGFIILLLLSLLFVLWCRKRHKWSTNAASQEVIYSEIEERPPQLPPPRNTDPPYAKIIGTLEPKT